MEEISHKVRLTSAEIANLWSQYVNDSMSLCVLKYYLKTVDDKDIKAILEYAKSLTEVHLKQIEDFLKNEHYPVPKGFTNRDVNLEAPKLFSDIFIIVYMQIMTIHGLTGYAGAVSTSIREDQVNYFIKCNTEAMELYRRILHVMVHKGIVSRPPNLTAPETIDFVKKQSFLTGWFGDRRPLNAVEFSGLFFNMQKNIVKIVLEIGFSLVTQSQELREYFQRGEKLCNKHFDIFSTILDESNLPAPPKYDAEISNSTVSPFSDKLLLFHIVTLISTASGYYGAAFSLSQRRDLATKYAILIAEITKYAEDGVNIMIDKGWMEQPPTFVDRKDLASEK
ncbi:MAG: DUF3231 family protein [Bacillota bacterium]